VAVFGVSGFSGRHFEAYVAKNGLSESFRFFGQTRTAAKAAMSGVFEYREFDPRNSSHIREFLGEVRPAYVLNLIGRFRADCFTEFIELHVELSRAICQSVCDLGFRPAKILLVGSAAEYGGCNSNPVGEDAETAPITFYGLSKLYQTLLGQYFFRNHDLPVVIARPFNILGSGMSKDLSIGSFQAQIEELPVGGVMSVGNISTGRDFLDIMEVCRRYWTLLKRGTPGEVYNICSGEVRTIDAVLREMIALSGKSLRVAVDPARIKTHDVQMIYGDPTKFAALDRCS